MATRQYKSRVYFSTATTGTGTLTVGTAETGFRLPTSDLDTKEIDFIIEDGDAWEKSTGIYTHSGTTLTRVLVESSTASLLVLTGSAKVFIDLNDVAVNNMYRLNNDVATTAPGVGNDNTQGYAVGSRWTNVTADNTYLCQDVSTGAAVWAQTDAAAGSGDLVSTNNLSDVTNAATSLGNLNGQTLDAGLTSISGLTTLADRMIYTTASDTYAVTTLTSAGRALIDDASATAQRTTLGSTAVGDAIFIAATAAAARGTLGLDTGNSPQFTGIELGHATDSTITRVSAGLLAVEGNNIALVGTAQEYTRTQNFNATSLTSTTNAVAWVASSNQVVSHTLTENTTFSAPSALVDGAFYSLAIIQDAGASSFTIAFNAVFKFTGGAAPTWTVTANARDYITFRSNGTNLYEVGHSLAVA